MLIYALRRIASTIPVMAIVALLVFSILHLAPGDPAIIIAGDHATPEVVAKIRQALELDRPYLVQFAHWVGRIASGDLGVSLFTNLPVSRMILQRTEPTLSLMVLTLTIAVLVAVPLGIISAAKSGSMVDRFVALVSVVGFSVPVFVVGYVLVHIFSLQLKLLPVQGFRPISEGIGPFLRSLILPATAMSLGYIALIARITRGSMLEVMSQDYVRTARAKGCGMFRVLVVHSLRNAAIPIVTIIGIGFAALIGGAVIVETVFAIPGIGRLVIDAILQRDYPVIQGVVLIFSFAYVILNLLIDLIYTWLDPRIHY